MVETICEINKTSNIRNMPMTLRRELAWFFSYYRLSHLIHDLGVEFTVFQDTDAGEKTQIKAFFQGISIMILYPSDLESVRRFCNDRFYALSLLGNYEDIVVLDLGAFIGTSSLFFAKNPNVKKVYAYEIYPENYKRLCSNLNLNLPGAGTDKIETFNCGIGTKDIVQEFAVYENDPFFNGINQEYDAYKAAWGQIFNISALRFEKMEYRSILKVFQDLLTEHGFLENIFLKIDIEGMEYEVLPMLLRSDFSPLIKAITGEFHRPGIEEIFKGTNFEFHYNKVELSMFGKNHGFFSAINLNA